MQADQLVAQVVEWIRTHQERFWTIVGAAAVTATVAVVTLLHRQTQTNDAWSQLGPIQGQIMQSPTPETATALETWSKRFGSTSAAPYAKFLKADLLYKTTDFPAAAQVYADLAEHASPIDMRPLALAGQQSAEEMAGRLPNALSLAQTFIQRYPDHFLVASMYLAQARLQESTGDRPGAAASYDKLIALFPQSPWTELARTRVQVLTGAAPKTAAK
jgi:outer membrane protein assembly factor BamD (BamD/ComL family)